MLVHPLCCNDDRAGEIGPTFHFMTRHDLVLANDRIVKLFIGSGSVGLFFALLAIAFTLSGLINMQLARAFMFGAWLVIVLGALVSDYLCQK